MREKVKAVIMCTSIMLLNASGTTLNADKARLDRCLEMCNKKYSDIKEIDRGMLVYLPTQEAKDEAVKMSDNWFTQCKKNCHEYEKALELLHPGTQSTPNK